MVVPLAFVAAMPPKEASAPGSTGKKRPVPFRASFKALRVRPGSTTQEKSWGLTSRTRFIRLRSRLMASLTG